MMLFFAITLVVLSCFCKYMINYKASIFNFDDEQEFLKNGTPHSRYLVMS